MVLSTLQSTLSKKLQRIIYRAVKRRRSFSLRSEFADLELVPVDLTAHREHVDKGTAVSLRRVAH